MSNPNFYIFFLTKKFSTQFQLEKFWFLYTSSFNNKLFEFLFKSINFFFIKEDINFGSNKNFYNFILSFVSAQYF